MKRREPHKTAEDLGAFGMQAERHWREHRPKLTAALEAEGTLYDHLAEVEVRFLELSDQLWKTGTPAMEAEQAAMREFIFLPDSE